MLCLSELRNALIKETSKGFPYNADDKSVGDEVLGPGTGSNRDSDVVTANDRPFVIHSGFASRIEKDGIYITSKHGNFGLYETEISDATLGLGSKYAIYYTKRKKSITIREEKPIWHRKYSRIIQWRHSHLSSIWPCF